MTRIDFYILGSNEPQALLGFSCRLAEKAWRSGHRVLLHCADEQQAEELDRQLWAFRADSFVPHSGDPEADEAVAICHGGSNAPLGRHSDLLINIASTLPEQFSRFSRLAEIADQRPALIEASRQRYAFYKHRGYPLQSHVVQHSEGGQ